MHVTVNGKATEIPEGLSVMDYLDQRAVPQDSVVVELNGTILTRPDWPVWLLTAGDRLEIVRFVQGG